MSIETAQSTVEVFMHGFSAGMAVAFVLVWGLALIRARRDP